MKRLLAVWMIASALCFAQNGSNGNVIVVGNEAQPVQPTHKQNIQEAIKKAGIGGVVIIPADYLYPTETFTNPNGILVIDLRANTFKVNGGVEIPPGSFLLLGYSPLTNYYPNSATGTVCNRLVKLDASGNAQVTAGGETSGVIGVAVSGCGTTGTVQVASVGQVPILFDTASVTLSDYVGISAGSGLVADVGAAPGSGQNIGRIVRKPDGSAPSSCNAGANCYVQLQLGSSGGGGGGGCVGTCVLLAPAGNQTITQPGGTSLTISGGNLNVVAPGAISGFQGPDSGASAQSNGVNNTWQFSAGSGPATNTLPPGGNYLPIWAPKVSGVAYASVLEALANKDQLNGYPSLDSSGQVPIAEWVVDPSGCNSTTTPKGDRSGCVAVGGSPNFSSILAGQSGVHLQMGPGGLLDATGGGIINVNQVASNVFSLVGAANQMFISTGPAAIGNAPIPNCLGGQNALQFSTTTHLPSCATIASGVPMIPFVCTGAAGACPNATEYNGTSADHVLYQAQIGAGQLTSGKCIHATVWMQHTTGTATVSYRWNVGGTGAVDTDISGGTSGGNMSPSSGGTANYMESQIDVCAYTSSLVYMRSHALQAGTSQTAGDIKNTVTLIIASAWNLSFTFNVAPGDKVTGQGGYVNFP